MGSKKLVETEVDCDKAKRGGGAKCSKRVVLEVITVNWCKTMPIGKHQWEFRRDLA